MTSFDIWTAATLILIMAIITRAAMGRIISYPECTKQPLPPKGSSIIILLYKLLTRGFRAMVHDQYTKFGSVFTISSFGPKVTFLIGPQVSGHFFQGMESDISHGNSLEFTVPMLGKEVGYAIDWTTRYEQNRFHIDSLKPSKLRCHVGPMLQEVVDFFSKWGEQGTADIKQELDELLMLISGRCLLGKEVRENMFNEVVRSFHELIDNGLCMTNVLFPYIPKPTTYRRDRAHARLSKTFTEIVRTRRSSNQVEEDVLQNLIDSKYKDGRPTTDAEVTGLIIGLLFAGKHTSSTTSTWTGACLLSNTQCLAAAIQEQQQIIRKYGNQIDYNILLKMDYLHRCIKEAMRMHPPMPMFLRKVHKNFTVQTREGAEYEIPRGHTVVSPLLYNNYIPYIYKDPDMYDPDRFAPGREEDRVGGKFSYTAFSGGRHACPGEAYAYMQIKVIWSHLLRNFELELLSPFPETDWGKIATGPKGKVMMSYKRRLFPIN